MKGLFLNWVVVDEQFKYISGGFDQIGTSEVVKPHNIPQINISKNGYIYVYCSNETEGLVFFDNLQLMHTKGAILEETHYYPFGLKMEGISSKAAGKMQNKEQTFQGQRFDDDLGLNWVQFKWRNHDPQIGRFIEIDPLSEEYVYNSTYAFSENLVTNHVELEGLEAISAGTPQGYLQHAFTKIAQAAADLFSFKSSVSKAREREVTTETKTSVATVDIKQTTTLGEKKFEVNSNVREWMDKGGNGVNIFEMKYSNNTTKQDATQPWFVAHETKGWAESSKMK
jgi:RHS repeat-associated protein